MKNQYLVLLILKFLIGSGECLNVFEKLLNLEPVYPICPDLDTSKIGVAYLFLPDRFLSSRVQSNPTNGGIFKLHHFYSLLLMAKMFKSNRANQLLFYYINDSGRPVSNHYNRWIDEPHWQNVIGFKNIKFIQLNVEPEANNTRLNLFNLIDKVKEDSLKRLDKKKYLVMATSDVIVGPKLLSCFSQIQNVSDDNEDDLKYLFDTERLRDKLTSECYKQLHSDQAMYSFAYQLNMIHHETDFSGILIWKLNSTKQHNELIRSQVMLESNYKCHYKQDVFVANPLAQNSFDNTFCVFGYELNYHEVPRLEDVFFANTYFNQLIRTFAYQRRNSIGYDRGEANIPNIVHMIWLSAHPRGLKFIEYLCLKSILTVLQPAKVRIHGDNKPIGDYWEQLAADSRIEWVDYKVNFFKFGQNFSESPIQHLADIARLEVMYEEGGIYSDFDILWVKPLDKLRHMNVELVASNDITSWCPEFPNSIQIGAFLAKPKSEFVKKWLHAYRDKYHLFPGDYVAVSMCEPYKLYEIDPTKVLIDNRLQMIYFNGWSSFIPRYLNVDQEKLVDFNQNLDWLNNGTHGYHLPRHSSLFSRAEFDKADQSVLPIKIASYILNLPLD